MNVKAKSTGNVKAVSVLTAAERPQVRWLHDPNVIVQAVQELIFKARTPLSVEKLIGLLEKEYKIKIPGEGIPIQRMILNSLLRLVSQEPGGLVVRRRAGVDLPEGDMDQNPQLRQLLLDKGLSEEDVAEILQASRAA